MAYNFEFELTAADYEEYNVHLTKKKYRKAGWRRYVLGGALLLLCGFNLYRTGFEFTALDFFLIGIVLWYMFLIPWQLAYTARKNIRQMIAKARPGSLVGMLKMTIDESSVQSTGTLTESTVKWGAVQTVEATKKHVYIYLSSYGALIVPCAVIGNQVAIDEFVAFVKAQIDRSYNKEEIAQHLV